MQRPIAVLLLLFSTLAAAAPPAWQLDPTFGVGGVNTLGFDLGGFNADEATALARDAQDRLYLIGLVDRESSDCVAIARYLPDGELDTEGYGENGRVCHDTLPVKIGEYAPLDAAIQADGKLLVAGRIGSEHEPVVCRFDATGKLDVEFGSATPPGCVVFPDLEEIGNYVPSGAPAGFGLMDLALSADRILLTMTAGEVEDVRMGRLSLDGDIILFGQDATSSIFQVADNVEKAATSDIALTADGMLLVTGAFKSPDTEGWDVFVARIDPDTGARDPAFNGNGLRGIEFEIPTAMAIAPDGGIVVAGVADTAYGTRPAVAVLTTSGELAAQFNGGAPTTYNPCTFYVGDCHIFVTGLELVPGDKMLLGGYADQDGSTRMFTMRLGSNGMPDPSYGPNILGQQGYAPITGETWEFAAAMLLQDGRAVLGGWRETKGNGDIDFLNNSDFLIARLSDGSLFRDGFDAVP